MIHIIADTYAVLRTKERGIELRYADEFVRGLGGSLLLTACALAQWKHSVVVNSVLGGDALGRYLQDTLIRKGVNLSQAILEKGWQTPLVLAGVDSKGKSMALPFRAGGGHPNGLSGFFKAEAEDVVLLGMEALERYPCHEMEKDLSRLRQAGCHLALCEDSYLAGSGSGNRRIVGSDPLHLWDLILLARPPHNSVLGEKLQTTLIWLDEGKLYARMGNDTIELDVPYDGTEPYREPAQYATLTAGIISALWGESCFDQRGNGEKRLDQSSFLLNGLYHGLSAAALTTYKKAGAVFVPTISEVRELQDKIYTNKEKQVAEPSAKCENADSHRPLYHIAPQSGWCNDPNGLVQYKGQYHAFFQHHPHSAAWGPMHWGHAVSMDLFRWNILPIALYPDQTYEKGCFSGSAVDNDGVLTLFYTAHDDEVSPKEKVCVATSQDGIHFDKYEGNPVIPAPPPGFDEDFRDPKVFFSHGRWNMVVGASYREEACVCYYTSTNTTDWEYQGVLCKSDGTQGTMWECPDLFLVDGQYILLVSPMKMKGHKAIFIMGDMDFENNRFTQQKFHEVDLGFEFYAPQTFCDDKGRQILIGWMDMWSGEFPTQKQGWAGALTIPRQLIFKNDHVYQRPVEELASLRSRTLHTGTILLKDGVRNNLDGIRGDCIEMKFNICADSVSGGKFYLNLRMAADRSEKTSLCVDMKKMVLTIDRQHAGEGKKDVTHISIHDIGEWIGLWLFLDRSCLEVFINDGYTVLSSRIYPKATSVLCEAYTKGMDLELIDFEAYTLEDASRNL